MKLESLKSSKFEAFKGSEIVNAMSIKGGACTVTGLGTGAAFVANDTYNKEWSTTGRNAEQKEQNDFGKLNDIRCQVSADPGGNTGGATSFTTQASQVSFNL